jgi:hypothetical protein
MGSSLKSIRGDEKRTVRARIIIATALCAVALHVLLPQFLAGWLLLVARTATAVAAAAVIVTLSPGLPWVLAAALLILLPFYLRPLRGIFPGVAAIVFLGGPVLCLAAAAFVGFVLMRRRRVDGDR